MKTVTGRLVLDEHVARVVEFMERAVPAARLVDVAQHLPVIARVLWSEDRCAVTYKEPLSRETQSVASESDLAARCAGGDSVAATDAD
jgi:hypothetical protein